MKTYVGPKGFHTDGSPDPIESYIITPKETQMAKSKKKSTAAVIAAGPTPTKRNTVAMRFARTLGATIIGFAAAWLVGPDAASVITNPTYQALLVGLVVPAMVALEKSLRYGSEKGEDPSDSIL